MATKADNLDEALALIRQLESALLGLRQIRGYVPKGAGLDTLDQLIDEIETNLAGIKRRVMQ